MRLSLVVYKANAAAHEVHAALAGPGVIALLAFVACVGDDPGVYDLGTDGGDGVVERDSGSTGPADPPPPRDDGGAGADGSSLEEPDAATTFCKATAPPTGVADFFCADFDGDDLTAGWTRQDPADAGDDLKKVTHTFLSPPNAFTSTKNARLIWEKPGTSLIEQVEVRFGLNPSKSAGPTDAPHNAVAFLDLEIGVSGGAGAKVTFAYVKDSKLTPTPHTGYALLSDSCQEECSTTAVAVPSPPPNDVWTTVKLVWHKSGQTTLSYNDDAPILSTELASATAAFARIQLGAAPYLTVGPAPPAVGPHVFDNVVVSVKRQ